MNMKPLILVKLGGSLVTDKSKPFTPRLEAIKRLAYEIAEARRQREISLVIGNGAGSFAHTPAKKYQTQNGLINKESLHGFAIVQDAAAKLNRIVVEELIAAGEDAISINPSSAVIAENGDIKQFFIKPLLNLLELNAVPVVYGDVVVDTKMGCSIQSTEKILNHLALQLQDKKYRIKNLVHYCTTNGVLDEAGNTISKITPKNFLEVKRAIGGSEGIDVTGGMLHKVEEGLILAEKGVSTCIINGFEHEDLKKLILGQKVSGTLITSQV